MFISQSLLLTNQGEIIINFLEIEDWVFLDITCKYFWMILYCLFSGLEKIIGRKLGCSVFNSGPRDFGKSFF